MNRAITMHTVDFNVEFVEEGEIEAIYVGSTNVTEVIRDCTRDALQSVVAYNAARWFREYRQELAMQEREERRAA
jgi:hypothetical protein